MYLTPIVAAGRVASTATGMPVREIVNFLVSFVHVPFALLALVIFDRLLRLYGSAPRDRRILVLALGLGSLSWRYAAYDFSEAAQMALLLATVYGLVRGTTRSLSFASIAFGALITVKLVHAALIPALVGYIALRFRGTQRAKFTGVFAASISGRSTWRGTTVHHGCAVCPSRPSSWRCTSHENPSQLISLNPFEFQPLPSVGSPFGVSGIIEVSSKGVLP